MYYSLCSALNSDLFMKNIVESPSCTCGAIENAYHFFFMCGRYMNQCNDLLRDLNVIQNINLKLLLFGDISRSIEANTRIFEAVQNFIGKTKRFT